MDGWRLMVLTEGFYAWNSTLISQYHRISINTVNIFNNVKLDPFLNHYYLYMTLIKGPKHQSRLSFQ